MKICFFDLEGWEFDKIREFAGKLGIKDEDLLMSEYSIQEHEEGDYKDAEIVCTFIYSKLRRDILEKMPKLKYIITRSVGYDHIDLEYCKQKGIKVYNIPDYGPRTVAEFTFLLILALVKNFKKILKIIEQGLTINPLELRGYDLEGKTLGVIGTGKIGTEVIKIAKAFNMNILAYSRTVRQDLVEKYGVKYVDLKTLLENSDIITIHVPLTPETRYLINMENVKYIKRGAYLVNTARGEVVQTEALVYALENGILAGAALDVFEGEEIFQEPLGVMHKKFDYEKLRKFVEIIALERFPNVIITPHIAYNTWEAVKRIWNRTLETIENLIKGKEDLPNLVKY